MTSLLCLAKALTIQAAVAAAAAAGTETAAAAEDSALLQQTALRGAAAPRRRLLPPPGQLGLACKELVSSKAHPVAVRNDDVENQLSYLARGSAAPEVLQGIYWMDQTGYYQTRPDRPDQAGDYEVVSGKSAWYKTFPHTLPSAAAELLLSFGPSTYDNESRCLLLSPWTDQWLWANTTGTAAGSATWADSAKASFLQFCFDEAMSEISILRQHCDEDLDSSPVTDLGQSMIPRSWGFERLNRKDGEVVTRYAAYQIVDGLGQRTRHYQAWLDFMEAECWYTHKQMSEADVPHWNDTLCRSQGGYRVNLGDGYSVLGRKGPA